MKLTLSLQKIILYTLLYNSYSPSSVYSSFTVCTLKYPSSEQENKKLHTVEETFTTNNSNFKCEWVQIEVILSKQFTQLIILKIRKIMGLL